MADELWQNRGGTLEKMDLGGGGGSTPIATLTDVGTVKPDGTSTTVDADGTLHATAGTLATPHTPGIIQVDNVTTGIDASGMLFAAGSHIDISEDPPVGAIFNYTGTDLPADGTYLWADGSTVKIADYPELFAAIGNAYAMGGEGPDEFRLPEANATYIDRVGVPILVKENFNAAWYGIYGFTTSYSYNRMSMEQGIQLMPDTGGGVVHLPAQGGNIITVSIADGSVTKTYASMPANHAVYDRRTQKIFVHYYSGNHQLFPDGSSMMVSSSNNKSGPGEASCIMHLDEDRRNVWLSGMDSGYGVSQLWKDIDHNPTVVTAAGNGSTYHTFLDRATGNLWQATTSSLKWISPDAPASPTSHPYPINTDTRAGWGIGRDAMWAHKGTFLYRMERDPLDPSRFGASDIASPDFAPAGCYPQGLQIAANGDVVGFSRMPYPNSTFLSIYSVKDGTVNKVVWPDGSGIRVIDARLDHDGEWLYFLTSTSATVTASSAPASLYRMRISAQLRQNGDYKIIKAVRRKSELATPTSTGQVKPDNATITIDGDGTLHAVIPGGGAAAVLPAACGTLGSVIPDCDTIQVDGRGVISVDAEATAEAMKESIREIIRESGESIREIIKETIVEEEIRELIRDAVGGYALATCATNGVARPDCDTIKVDGDGVLSVDVDAVKDAVQIILDGGTYPVPKSRHGEVLRDADGNDVAVIFGSVESGGQEPWVIHGRKTWLAVACANVRTSRMEFGLVGAAIPGADTVRVDSGYYTSPDNDGTYRVDLVFPSDAAQDSRAKTDIILAAAQAAGTTAPAAEYCRSFVPVVDGTPTPMDMPRLTVLYRAWEAMDLIDAVDPGIGKAPWQPLSGGEWGDMYGRFLSSSILGNAANSTIIYIPKDGSPKSETDRSFAFYVLPMLEIPAE